MQAVKIAILCAHPFGCYIVASQNSMMCAHPFGHWLYFLPRRTYVIVLFLPEKYNTQRDNRSHSIPFRTQYKNMILRQSYEGIPLQNQGYHHVGLTRLHSTPTRKYYFGCISGIMYLYGVPQTRPVAYRRPPAGEAQSAYPSLGSRYYISALIVNDDDEQREDWILSAE